MRYGTIIFWLVPLLAAAGPCAWTTITLPPDVKLSESQFVTPAIGWVHNDTCIWHTTDAGHHWNRQYCVSLPGESLRDLQFLTPEQGWLVAGPSTLLHTTNGGKIWTPRTFDRALISHVRFFDSQYGWWTGEQRMAGIPDGRGIVYATRDGGKTWRETPTGINLPDRWRLESVWPRSATEAWVVGDFLLQTKDGGKTWHQPHISQELLLRLRNVAIRFASERVGWIRRVPAEDYLLTLDAGASWIARKPPTVPPFLDDLLYIDDKEAWAVAGHVYRSLSAGKSWHRELVGGEELRFSRLQHLRSHQLLIALAPRQLASIDLRSCR